MSTTVKEYQFRVSAVNAGASDVFKRVGGDVRKEIDLIQKKASQEYGLRGPSGSVGRANASYATAAAGTNRQTTARDMDAIVAARAKADAERNAIAARVDRNWEAASFEKYKEEEKAKADAGKGGPLSGLRESFGRGSTFGGLAKAAAGGGAILGLSLAAREVEEVTAKVKDLAEGLRLGSIAAGEIPNEIAKAIPILSSLRQGVENVYDIATAQGRADVQRRLDIKAFADLTEFEGERLLAVRDRNAEILDIQLKMKSEMGQLGLLGGARERAGIAGQAAVDAHDDEAEAIKRKGEIRKKYVDAADDYKTQKGANFRTTDPSFVQLMAKEQKEMDAEDERVAASARKREEVNKGLTAESEERSKKAFAAQAREGEAGNFREGNEIAASDAKYLGRVSEQGIAAAAEERKRAILEINRKAAQDADEAQRSGADESAVAGINDRAKQAAALEIAKEEQKVREINREQIERTGEVESRIRQAQIAGIDAELAGDNRIHEQEKARLEIQEKFAAKRRELTDLLLQAEAAQRPAVQAQIDQLDAQESQAQAARETLTLEEDKLRLLQEQAQYGDVAAKAELARAEAAKKYREEVQRLQGIIASQSGTAGAAEAARRLASLPGIESQRVAHGLEDTQVRLAQASSANSPAAQRLIAQFQAAKQFRDIKAELESVLKDDGATAAQKAQAAGALQTLPLSAQSAIANAGISHHPISLTSENEQNYSGIFGRAGLTGAGREAQEKAFLQQGKSIDRLATSNDALAAALRALVADLAGSSEQDPFKGRR